MCGQHSTGPHAASGDSRIPSKQQEQDSVPEEPIQGSARLAIEGAGFVAGEIEFDVLLIHAFIAVDTILFRVIPHDVVPPVEKRIDFSLIYRIAEVAPCILLHHPSSDVIYLAIAIEGIQHEKQSRFMVVQLVDAGADIWLDRQDIFRPDVCSRQEETQGEKKQDDTLPHRHGGILVCGRHDEMHATTLDVVLQPLCRGRTATCPVGGQLSIMCNR
jgi:hypothetical protein